MSCIDCGHGESLHTEFQNVKECRHGLCKCQGFKLQKLTEVKS